MAIRVEGTIDDELRLGLAASGVRVVGLDEPGATALFAPGATIARLTELASQSLPVVTDVEPGDFEGLTARVRAGVRDVIARPARAEVLTRKLRRIGPA